MNVTECLLTGVASIGLAYLIAMAAASGWYGVKYRRQREFIKQLETEHDTNG